MAIIETVLARRITVLIDAAGGVGTATSETDTVLERDGEKVGQRRDVATLSEADLKTILPDRAALLAQVAALTADRDAALAARDIAETALATVTAERDEARTTRDATALQLAAMLGGTGSGQGQDEYARAVQAHVDATAVARGYRDGVTCASYASSTVAPWAADAAAFVSWRDSVWTSAYGMLQAVQAGQSAPTIAAVIAALPTINWNI